MNSEAGGRRKKLEADKLGRVGLACNFVDPLLPILLLMILVLKYFSYYSFFLVG